jgi:hypothetical protein
LKASLETHLMAARWTGDAEGSDGSQSRVAELSVEQQSSISRAGVRLTLTPGKKLAHTVGGRPQFE